MKGLVSSLFLDSGSFTLWTKAKKYAKEHRCGEYDYYDTPDFWQYMDGYAEFVKTTPGIDVYANVDAIPHPRLTWRNQQYLEKEHGLTPVPVVHLGTDIKWLKHYVDRGYDYIAFGGMVGGNWDGVINWLNENFSHLCPPPKRTPLVKVHGFGITAHELLIKYPWYSVDSTTWIMAAACGELYVPVRRVGKGGKQDFHFNVTRPKRIYFSSRSPRMQDSNGASRHYMALSSSEKKDMLAWVEYTGIPLGKVEKGEVVEEGVVTSRDLRCSANVVYFQELAKRLPPWPRKFDSATFIKGFGVGTKQ